MISAAELRNPDYVIPKMEGIFSQINNVDARIQNIFATVREAYSLYHSHTIAVSEHINRMEKDLVERIKNTDFEAYRQKCIEEDQAWHKAHPTRMVSHEEFERIKHEPRAPIDESYHESDDSFAFLGKALQQHQKILDIFLNGIANARTKFDALQPNPEDQETFSELHSNCERLANTRRDELQIDVGKNASKFWFSCLNNDVK
jgi:hypothetical protein